MKKRNRNKARKRSPRGNSSQSSSVHLADLFGALFCLGVSMVVSLPVNYLADGGKPPAPEQVRARRTDRLLDALSRALAAGDAVSVERIKSVLASLNSKPSNPVE